MKTKVREFFKSYEMVSKLSPPPSSSHPSQSTDLPLPNPFSTLLLPHLFFLLLLFFLPLAILNNLTPSFDRRPVFIGTVCIAHFPCACADAPAAFMSCRSRNDARSMQARYLDTVCLPKKVVENEKKRKKEKRQQKKMQDEKKEKRKTGKRKAFRVRVPTWNGKLVHLRTVAGRGSM